MVILVKSPPILDQRCFVLKIFAIPLFSNMPLCEASRIATFLWPPLASHPDQEVFQCIEIKLQHCLLNGQSKNRCRNVSLYVGHKAHMSDYFLQVHNSSYQACLWCSACQLGVANQTLFIFIVHLAFQIHLSVESVV